MTENRFSRPGAHSARALVARAARAFALLCCAAASASAAPVIITENNSTRAVAVDALTKLRDPFSVTSPGFVGSDRRTRVQFFVMNLELLAGEGANALSVDAQDGAGKVYELTVEDVRPVPDFGGLQQVTVLLRGDMANVGDVLVRVSLHGVASNRARLSIGQVTATPADDPGAVPNPAPSIPPAPTPTPAPNAYGPGAAGSADATRFLEQATWGPTAPEVARVRALGIRAYLNEQLAAPVCFRDNYTIYPLQVRFFQNALGQNAQAGQPSDQLRQRVSWALHQTFVVSGREFPYTAWMAAYVRTLDRNAFGNYRTLLKEITLNPSMGEYLNMRDNRASNPNENFAREILQLFSIGLDELNLDGTPKLDAEGRRIPTYDQQTVTNFARVFTGWRESATLPPGTPPGALNYKDPMVLRSGSTSNPASNHDIGQKVLLGGFVINPLTGTTTGQARVDYANASLDAALDNIFNHPSAGPFIGKQLIQHLVTSNPSPAYVERVARAFNNDCDSLYPDNCQNVRGDLRATVRAVLLDPEARGDAKTDPRYGRLREPVQFITNVLRAFNASAHNNPSAPSDGVLGTRSRRGDLPGSLDQPVYLPASVFSYYTPLYEVPGTKLFGPAFEILSTSTALRRANVANQLIYQGIDPFAPDTPAGTQLNLASPNFNLEALGGDPAALVAALDSLLMHNTMSAPMRQGIIDVLTNNITAATDPDQTFRNRKRAQTAVYLVVTSPQYQVQR
ncbi:MAG: DUF1800 domain-containing protein [Acidobacteria bacterium]|nr:DUF1800 domain-containing protein [Acidobacteriota bacterium]